MNNQGPPPGPYGYGPPPPHGQQQHHHQGYPMAPYGAPQAPLVVNVQQNTVMAKPPFNHTKHLIVDLVTCGAWLPFHIILWLVH